MECLFCGIANGKVPNYTIFKDEYTFAFLDIANDVDGHTIIIPKKHVENIVDCDSDTLMRLMNTVQRVSTYFIENCGYHGVNILNASGEAAQQSIQHFHIHIIPRKEKDGIDAWPVFGGARESAEVMLTKLKL